MASPDSPDPNDAIVDHARGALRGLMNAEPSKESARAALEELEAAWRRRPFTVGVMGDDAFARTELLNALCGGAMFEAKGRGPGAAPVRVRRGETTRFRARRKDGTVEEATLPADAELPAAAGAAGAATPGRARRATTEVIRAQVSQQELELLRAEREVPRLAREVPPWWAFWLWMIRWLVVRRARARLEAWQRAKLQLAEGQRELTTATEESVPVEAAPAVSGAAPGPRERFLERLRMLGSGNLAGRDIEEIQLEVASGPLSDEIEVIELTGTAPPARVDLTVRVTASQVEISRGESSMRKELGPPASAARELAPLATQARALWVARRAREVLLAEILRLDEAAMNVEIGLRNRIARIENLRMPDAESFVPTQLERIGPQAAGSINAVLEHAGAHLGSELAQLTAQWDAELKTVSTVDALKALAARIDGESVTEYKRIADETRMLVMGGVGGSAYDLLSVVFAALRQPGLPDEHAVPPRRVPSLSPVAMLPSLTNPQSSAFAGELSGAGQWLAGLFRSVETKRAELRGKVHDHSERVRAAAEAELLDAEPKLRAALLEAVGRELSVAVERRVTWLATELAREQLTVDAERAAMQPLVEVLEDARREARSLQERVGSIEAPPA
jgi:hypothetical protein